jgi:integrase
LSTPSCSQCGSTRLYKDGLRRLASGDEVQRWLCRDCGFRFSQPRQDNSDQLQQVSKVDTLSLNRSPAYPSSRQVCDLIEESKNLAEVARQETAAGATISDPATIKGKLLQFGLWLQKQGYSKETTKTWPIWLNSLVKSGSNLWDSETIKEVLGKQQQWSSSYKMLLAYAYESFLKMENMTWIRPRYTQNESFPFIPTEQELDQLISASSKVLSTFLQGLKDTGADPGELAKLKWTDINKESTTVNITPVKGHTPRILRVSQQFIDRLDQFPKKSERVFPKILSLDQRFFHQRKRIAHKLNNPRLMKISFRTFRHWKGTMEYHRTRDILYVKRILGHKIIQNTLKYIDLETSLFGSTDDQFNVKVAANVHEACKLAEVGFEYVTGEYTDGGKIFRKRK